MGGKDSKYVSTAKFALGFAFGEWMTSRIHIKVDPLVPMWFLKALCGKFTLNLLTNGFEKTWTWITNGVKEPTNWIILGAKSCVFAFAKDRKANGDLSFLPDWLNPLKFIMMATGPLIGWGTTCCKSSGSRQVLRELRTEGSDEPLPKRMLHATKKTNRKRKAARQDPDPFVIVVVSAVILVCFISALCICCQLYGEKSEEQQQCD